MSWIAPITDRTAADITNRTARGFFNASDINRIEGNIAWLRNELARHNHFVEINTVTGWLATSVPTIADLQRVRNNIDAIAAQVRLARPDFRVNMQTVNNTAFPRLDFNTVNRLEINIYLLRQLIDRMSTVYRQASFKSGQQLFLSQRRV